MKCCRNINSSQLLIGITLQSLSFTSKICLVKVSSRSQGLQGLTWLRLNITFQKVLNTGNKINEEVTTNLRLHVEAGMFFSVIFLNMMRCVFSITSWNVPLVQHHYSEEKTVWFIVCMSSLIKPHFGKLC